MPAMARFAGAPYPGEPLPPAAAPPVQPTHPTATPSKVSPMAVMTVPVTTGGKRRSIRPTSGAASTPSAPAAMLAPKT